MAAMAALCLIRGFSRGKALGNLSPNNGTLKTSIQLAWRGHYDTRYDEALPAKFLKAVYNSCLLRADSSRALGLYICRSYQRAAARGYLSLSIFLFV